VSRVKRIGVSVSVLLAVLAGITCYILVNVWMFGRLTLQEPRFYVLVIETVGLGLTSLFGVFGVIYFWRYR